jgi:hypothetical protein
MDTNAEPYGRNCSCRGRGALVAIIRTELGHLRAAVSEACTPDDRAYSALYVNVRCGCPTNVYSP